MKKITKLRICDWSLLPLTILMLASGIQLEATHSSGILWLIIHIVIGVIFMGMIAWHIYLHFGKSNWFARFHKMKNQFTRVLWWVTILTLISGIATIIHWASYFGHTPLGGLHGKLGFLMIILVTLHAVKRRKFYTS